MEAGSLQEADAVIARTVREHLTNHVDAYPATLELLGVVLSAGMQAGSMGEDEGDVLAAIRALAQNYVADNDAPSASLLTP